MQDEFGQWVTDELTGEQGFIDDEGSCFWSWDNNEYTRPGPFLRAAKCRVEKARERKMAEVDQEEPEEHSLVKTSTGTRIVVRTFSCPP